MAQWYFKELSDGTEANAPSDAIQKAFLPLFIAAGQPIDMAVFSRYDLMKNIVNVYFSPSASRLAEKFGPSQCDKPSRENLALLVGDPRCFGFFYPTSY